MKNVLILIDKLARGGAEHNVMRFASALDRSKYNITVCSLGKDTTMAQDLRDAGLELIVLGYSKWNPFVVPRVVRLIRERSISLVHANLEKSVVAGWLAARRAGVRFVCHDCIGPAWPHFGGGIRHRLQNAIMCRATLFCMVRADAVIGVTEATRKWAIGMRPSLAKNMVVVQNALDVAEYAKIGSRRNEIRDEVRKELQLPDHSQIVFNAANLRPVKGWEFFVRCAAKVVEQSPDAHFVAAGKGPLYDELVALSRDLGVASNVHMLGVRSDVDRLLVASDVFFSTSIMESDHIAVKEAQILNLPVVLSDIPAHLEKVIEGETGFTARYDEVDTLSEKLLLLLSDPAMRSRMGEKAAAFAREHYDIKTCVAGIERVYDRVTGTLE